MNNPIGYARGLEKLEMALIYMHAIMLRGYQHPNLFELYGDVEVKRDKQGRGRGLSIQSDIQSSGAKLYPLLVTGFVEAGETLFLLRLNVRHARRRDLAGHRSGRHCRVCWWLNSFVRHLVPARHHVLTQVACTPYLSYWSPYARDLVKEILKTADHQDE